MAEHPASGLDRGVGRQLVGETRRPMGTALSVTGTVALAFWAVGEIFRGVIPWRRILGAVVQ
jgi:predicted DNA repair protein MutK